MYRKEQTVLLHCIMINMQQGRIIKIISNQYTIQNEKEEIIAKPRGKMRQQQTPVVGDFVEYEKIEDSYRIHKVLPRTNRLLRPAIANVDQALIVTSLKDPDYSCHLLNRLIFLVGLAGVKPVICVTKLDLLEDPEEILADLEKYKKAGYDVVFSNPGSDDRELQGILKICKDEKMPYFILGNGSNLLVSDEGYRGVIIQLYRNYGDITVKGNEIHATAGALLSQIAAAAKNASLTGFEFAGGIPGTLGGAVVMNAGAYGGEMKDVLKEVTVMTAAGEILVLPAEKLEMGYRTSLVKTKGYLVLSAVIVLEQGNQEAIKARMKELTEQRVSKQPLEFPSAGSTFKRPEGYFAGKLIMDAGLRGYQTGGAQVSEKHCGFVINKDNATAADVCRLLRDVQDKVKEQFGVTLEPEVKFLGKF